MSPQFVDFDGDGDDDIVGGIFDGSPHVSFWDNDREGYLQPVGILDKDGEHLWSKVQQGAPPDEKKLKDMFDAFIADSGHAADEERSLTAADLEVLGMVVRSSGLPQLQMLDLTSNSFGDQGLQRLCTGLGSGTQPPHWKWLAHG